MDMIPYEKQNIEELAKRTEYEISKISEFLSKIEIFVKNASHSLSILSYIYNKNNIPKIVVSKKSKNQRNEEKQRFLQNQQKVEKLQKMLFPLISQIEQNRLESDRGILVGCQTYDKLLKLGYTEQMIEQSVFNATRDEFWSKQFRSLAKLLRKNKDDVLYIDIFLAIGQKNHKVAIPRIVR